MCAEGTVFVVFQVAASLHALQAYDTESVAPQARIVCNGVCSL